LNADGAALSGRWLSTQRQDYRSGGRVQLLVQIPGLNHPSMIGDLYRLPEKEDAEQIDASKAHAENDDHQ
jgi:hypothetical protein